MATEKQAHAAREAVSDELFDLGAHAVAVDLVAREPEEFGVVAYVPKGNAKPFPKSCTVGSGPEAVKVPIVVKPADTFKPE